MMNSYRSKNNDIVGDVSFSSGVLYFGNLEKFEIGPNQLDTVEVI